MGASWLERKRKAIEVLIGPVRELSPAQIAGILKGKFLSESGEEAVEVRRVELCFESSAIEDIVRTRTPTPRGPRAGSSVLMKTLDPGENDPLDDELCWIEARFPDSDYVYYWPPREVTFVSHWDWGED